MSARPVKHSVTLRGHRTSISLEDEFWREFKLIAKDLDVPINALVTQIDAERGLEAGLASAIRVYVLKTLKDRLTKPQ